jgi:hypothetical protein
MQITFFLLLLFFIINILVLRLPKSYRKSNNNNNNKNNNNYNNINNINKKAHLKRSINSKIFLLYALYIFITIIIITINIITVVLIDFHNVILNFRNINNSID